MHTAVPPTPPSSRLLPASVLGALVLLLAATALLARQQPRGRHAVSLAAAPRSLPGFMAAPPQQLSTSYSLWLKPRPGTPVARALAREIAAQAQEQHAPLFEPHVTLLGDVGGSRQDVLDKAAQLAGRLKRFRVNFLDVAQGGAFHRCVYVLVAQEPAVMAAAAAAREAYGMQDAAPVRDYMPHVSLLYAEPAPEAKAAAAAAAVQRLYGEGSGYDTLLLDAGFEADALSVWFTPTEDRSLASWQQLGEYALGG